MIEIPTTKFTFALTPTAWAETASRLNTRWCDVETLDAFDLMGVHHRNRPSLTFEEATAVMLCMHIEGAGRLWITVHHACSPDESVAKRPWQEGFQPTPWTCPRCTKVARWSEDLTYEMELEMLQPVRFV